MNASTEQRDTQNNTLPGHNMSTHIPFITLMPTIDTYLSKLPPEQRALLQQLRKTIHEASPTAVEVISWNIPWFKYKGKYLVAFAALSHHCSFAVWGYPIASLQKHVDVSTYDTTKGVIRFTKPLPATLVKKIVKLRMQAIDGGAP